MPPLQLRSALSGLQLAPSPYLPTSNKPPPSRRTFVFPCFTLKPITAATTPCRSASSSAATTSSSSSQTSPIITSASHPGITSLPPNPPATQLTWDQYLQLRRTRRYYNLAASAATSLATTAAGVSILSQQNIEALSGTVPMLDPFILLGLATAGSGAVGWLMGPFVGNAVFGIAHRKLGTQIAAKDKDFYRRIKQYRVDPSSQSYSNPVPDYYGEKIGSVGEFRNWMKDQRAYNKKRQNFL